MRKKKIILIVGGLLILMCSGFVYVNENEVTWKTFYNLSSEPVYYPVSELTTLENLDNVSKKITKESIAPERAKVGEIFMGNDGYERVIAVSEDGAYVTESISPDEMGN